MRYSLLLSRVARRPLVRQTGIVLFFALLALAVMSIAAVALIRSVDTNALLSGNMVFRQSASTASNVALEGIAQSIAKNVSLSVSTAHHPGLGYYANCSQFDTRPDALVCDGNQLTTMAWNNGNSSLAPSQTDGNDEIRDGVDRQGNEIRYVVERMCNYSDAEIADGAALSDASRCMMASSPSNGENCSHNITNLELFKRCIASSDSPLYRVTLRIAGPKNTVTFLQTFISN
ncbi:MULTISPECIES: pilus assembly PilX N-terminal domain-containing protein [unclassified Methylophilus]|uniref:pilus assembly PilX family protein n=1 Tax=unclassified Methylophilus TaxID=2630143 RepID=UPI00037D6F7E|nr:MULTISPECIES: pilus assembly PilX N-terminal domain-containing protein [unclassified Methylophilus]